MIFSLDVRRARKGDCLLLHYGTMKNPRLAIIDGGPSNVYGPHLKPRLMEIRKARKLPSDKPLPVDLLMVSHVDDDHIRGILDLTKELRGATGTPFLRVGSFWHNSFDEIVANDAKEVKAQFGVASIKAGSPEDVDVESDEPEYAVSATLRVLASIEQGHRLRGDAEALKFARNPEYDGGLIHASAEDVEMDEGLTFRVAGPMMPELKALQKKHAEWLKSKKDDSPESSLAAYVDRSVPNLSSIVVLAKSNGKTMLLTGDARGDKILEGLEQVGAMDAGGTLEVDVVKVPHHGSANNLEADFFQRIRADHYVISGDGEHGNPERESVEMLFEARGKEPFTLHLTYPVEEIDAGREADWKKQQAKEKKKGKPVRPNWSAPKQSLAAFFEKNKLAPGQKIRIVDAEQPHLIDLLEPVPF